MAVHIKFSGLSDEAMTKRNITTRSVPGAVRLLQGLGKLSLVFFTARDGHWYLSVTAIPGRVDVPGEIALKTAGKKKYFASVEELEKFINGHAKAVFGHMAVDRRKVVITAAEWSRHSSFS